MTRWAPVVYGRTAASDTWWRAVPTTLDETGWLGSVVRAAVCGGRELDRAPRFLLSQDRTHRIVGVACQAADLNPAMSSDGDRQLYCFVGWAAPRDGQPESAGPSLQDLSRNYATWAGPVYTAILGRVWEVTATADCPPERTEPEQAPWPPAGRELAPAPRPAEGLWPQDAWPALWAAAQAASSPLTCVVGWRDASSARLDGATHVGAAGAPARPLPVPPRPLPPVRVPAPREIPAPEPVPPAIRVPKPEPVPPRSTSLGSKPAGRVAIPVALAAAAVIGAAVGAVITALVSGGPTGAAPVTIQLDVPSAVNPGPGALLRYQDGALLAGEAAARLAMWSGGSSAASAAACAAALRATTATAPIQPVRGVRICVELTGQPARYGLIEVTTVSPSSVTTLATIWP
jgi:hypothetical protein